MPYEPYARKIPNEKKHINRSAAEEIPYRRYLEGIV
jgi:hypothetical protein